MKKLLMKYLVSVVTIICSILLLSTTSSFAGQNKEMVNWEKGVIQATGFGVPPAQITSPQQASFMAKRAAVVDAYRNLAEAINGVQVDAETTVQNFQVTNDTVHSKVSALVRGASIIKEQQFPDGTYQIVMQINLYGSNSLAQALQDTNALPAQAFPQPVSSQEVGTTGYTGLIVDARGLGLERCMSPLIYSESGTIVYGNKYLDPAVVVNRGMVDYAASSQGVVEAGTDLSRGGSMPLVVKAIAVKNFSRNVVISDVDADRILTINAQNQMLRNLAVVFEE